MSTTTEIQVFLIAKSRLDADETREWLDHIGAVEFKQPMTYDADFGDKAADPRYDVNIRLTDAEAICGLAAKRCYMSFEAGLNPNVTRVRKDWVDYLSNILASGHGSVLEHATYTWAIEGVSRVFTGEMNRHRAGVAISEGSMRYIRMDEMKYWLPLSVRTELSTLDSREYTRRLMTQEVLERVFTFAEEQYARLEEIWGIDETTECLCTLMSIDPRPNCPLCSGTGIKSNLPFSRKKQLTSLFRRIVPMGIATGGVWTFNLRSLRHVLALRTEPAAEEEITYVCSLIAKQIIESEPKLMGDFEMDTETGAWVPKYRKV